MVLTGPVIMGISVPPGARLWNVLINSAYYGKHPEQVLALDFSGFSLMGGLLAAGLVGLISTRVLKIPLWPLADAAAPSLGIGLALMLVGCFLNGRCYGLPSQLPWAVSFPFGSPAYRYYLAQSQAAESGFQLGRLLGAPTLHPTQLYEMAAALLAAGVASYLIRQQARSGVPFLAAAIFFTAARFSNHFLRAQPVTYVVSSWFYPLLYLIIVLCLVLVLAYILKTAK